MHVPIFLDLSMTNIVRIRKVTFLCFHIIQRKSGVSLFSVAFFSQKVMQEAILLQCLSH